MYQCFHCLKNSIGRDCGYSFDDFGYDGEGIVQIYHCSNCGAEIEYRVPISLDDEADKKREQETFLGSEILKKIDAGKLQDEDMIKTDSKPDLTFIIDTWRHEYGEKTQLNDIHIYRQDGCLEDIYNEEEIAGIEFYKVG